MTNFWVIIAIILLIIEICTVNLVSIWFAIGAILSFITSLIFDNLIIELVVFIIGSIIALLITKPLVKRIKNNNTPTNSDRVIGMTGIVTEDIKKDEIGEVKVDGKKWSAISKESIKKGKKVEIIKIEGVKLVVKKRSDD